MIAKSPGYWLALADWRRNTAEMYTAVRNAETPYAGWRHFVRNRNQLFKTHSQTPLSNNQRADFQRLEYFPYDSNFRVLGQLDYDVVPEETTIELGGDGRFRYQRVAVVHFELCGQPGQLSLFWIKGYGGGLFLPFKDTTNKIDTFGGGRYLYDTIKGADLGAGESTIMLDFNFAYNPSCAYNSRWVCPLSPPENSLQRPVNAGEKGFN